MHNLRQATFLRVMLTEATSSATGELLTSAQQALNAVSAYEQALWRGSSVEAAPDAIGPVMRNRVLQYLLQRGVLPCTEWIRWAKLRQDVTRPRCFGCGRAAKAFTARLRVPGVSRRRITVCPHCSVVEDAPAHSNLTLSLHNGSLVRVSTDVPQGRWTGGLLLVSKLASDTRRFAWPSKDDGTPVETFQIPDPLPVGLVHVVLLMLWEGNLACVAQPLWSSGQRKSL